MLGERGLRVSLVLACVVHVGVLVAVRAVPPKGPPAAAAEALATFDLEEEPAAVPRAPEGSEPVAVAALDVARVPGSVAPRPVPAGAASPEANAAPAAATSAQAVPDGVVTAPDGQGWSFHAANVDLGIDPKKRPLLAMGSGSGEAPPRPGASPGALPGGPPPASTTGGLAEALDAHDVALGLGRGGAVNTAVRDAVQAANVMGKAIFAITIDGAGAVTVGLSDASQDERGWMKVTEAIRASVTARKDQLRLPPGSSGLRIAIETEAKDQYPNGAKPKDMGTKAVAKGPSTVETKDHVEIVLPDVGIEHRGKVCSVGVKLIPPFIAGGCDPSNIGSVAIRVVTARVVSESRL
jgi:hypothetical protein